jgi:hypothetical protein
MQAKKRRDFVDHRLTVRANYEIIAQLVVEYRNIELSKSKSRGEVKGGSA